MIHLLLQAFEINKAFDNLLTIPAKIIIIILGFLCFISNSYSITETEFVKLVLNSKRLHESERLRTKIKAISLEENYRNYGDWRWNIAGSVGKKKTLSDSDHLTSYNNESSSEVREISTNFEKRFFSTGAELNLKFARSNPTKFEQITNSTTPTRESFIEEERQHEFKKSSSITLSVPLLQNRGGIIEQKSYSSSLLDFQSRLLSQEYQLGQTLLKYLSLFYQWGMYEDKNSLLRKREKLLKNVGGFVTQENLIKQLQKLVSKTSKDTLATKNSATTIKKKLRLILPSRNESPEIDWSKEIHLISNPELYLKKHNLLLKKIAIQQQNNQVNLKAYRNQKRPKLDLVLSAQKNQYTGNYSSYTYLNEDDYKIEIKFSYPLFGDISNNANISKAVLYSRQFHLKYQDRLDSLLEKVDTLNKQILESKDAIKLIKQEINNDKLIERREFNNFKQGKIKLIVFIQAHNTWFKNVLALNKLLFEYRLNCARYNVLLNRLQDDYQISHTAKQKVAK